MPQNGSSVGWSPEEHHVVVLVHDVQNWISMCVCKHKEIKLYDDIGHAFLWQARKTSIYVPKINFFKTVQT